MTRRPPPLTKADLVRFCMLRRACRPGLTRLRLTPGRTAREVWARHGAGRKTGRYGADLLWLAVHACGLPSGESSGSARSAIRASVPWLRIERVIRCALAACTGLRVDDPDACEIAWRASEPERRAARRAAGLGS